MSYGEILTITGVYRLVTGEELQAQVSLSLG